MFVSTASGTLVRGLGQAPRIGRGRRNDTRARGISYDTGFVHNGAIGHKLFDPETVRRELRVIRDDLHCTAVRVMGGDPERMELAAAHAADLGLEVRFSPCPLELTADEMLSLFAGCAVRAERLRRRGSRGRVRHRRRAQPDEQEIPAR
ncbi:hypothetical protein [Streptosporangium sp. NPDC003464]